MEYMDIETVKELDHVFGDIEELQKFRCLMMQYECAMLEVKTKLDVLNTELSAPEQQKPDRVDKMQNQGTGQYHEENEASGDPVFGGQH